MLATLFGRNLSSSDFSSSLSYLSRKKGTSETFLSLGLFISRPRPTASASKIRLWLRKTFPQFPFFYFGNLEKLKSDEDKFFLRVASTIIETKYYSFFVQTQHSEVLWMTRGIFSQMKECFLYFSLNICRLEFHKDINF